MKTKATRKKQQQIKTTKNRAKQTNKQIKILFKNKRILFDSNLNEKFRKLTTPHTICH